MSSVTVQTHGEQQFTTAMAAAVAHTPTVADRFRDMLRYIDRETTRATYRTMTGGLEFVAATGENQHTLVVTMPPAAKVLWDRLAPLVHRAGLYAGFNTIETREVVAEAQEPKPTMETFKAGTVVHCNRCDKTFPLSRDRQGYPFADHSAATRLTEFERCPHCETRDTHYVYVRDNAKAEPPAPELREYRIEYYTMSDCKATATVKAANETAARQIVDKLPDCAAVIGGVR